MKHLQKVRLAKRMLTQKEIQDKVPHFLSSAWIIRKKARLMKEIAKRKENKKSSWQIK